MRICSACIALERKKVKSKQHMRIDKEIYSGYLSLDVSMCIEEWSLFAMVSWDRVLDPWDRELDPWDRDLATWD